MLCEVVTMCGTCVCESARQSLQQTLGTTEPEGAGAEHASTKHGRTTRRVGGWAAWPAKKRWFGRYGWEKDRKPPKKRGTQTKVETRSY